MTTKVKRGQNEGNRKREQSHWGKTEGINTQITSGLNGTENMSIWTWYKWLMTWKFATSAGKNTGGGLMTPRWWETLWSRPGSLCGVFRKKKLSVNLRLPELLLLLVVCPRERQPLPQHNIPSSLETCWVFFLSSFLLTFVLDIQQPWARSQWLPVAHYGSVDAWRSLWAEATLRPCLFKFIFV